MERVQMQTLDSAVRIINGMLGGLEAERLPRASNALSSSDAGDGAAAATTGMPGGASSKPAATSPVSAQLEELRGMQGGLAAEAGAGEAADGPKTKIRLQAKTSATRAITEVPGRSLADYLALPVEEYNMLDPQVVEYLGDSVFKLTFPFQEWFNLDVRPEAVVEIRPDQVNGRVLFICKSMKLGREEFDRDTTVHFATALSREEVSKARDKPAEVFLVSALQFAATLRVPRGARRVLPAPVLEGFGNRVLDAILKACLKPYMAQLAEDYANWAAGRQRVGGTLRPAESDMEAMALPAEGGAELGGLAGDGSKA